MLRRPSILWGFMLLPLVALWSDSTSAFQFYIHAGEKRCFSESVPPNTKVLGEYTVSTGKGHMPVDIKVTINDGSKTLYEKHDANHGKFAFVVPFSERTLGDVKVSTAEALRKSKEARDRLHESLKREKERHDENLRERLADHHRRKVLSVDDSPNKAEAHGHEDPFDYNYDYDDDFDDFEMGDYDGIHDDQLDDEVAKNEREHEQKYGTIDTASDYEREEQLFQVQKFEVCVSSNVEKQEVKRRVRLMINKGEAAHDFNRLAKKEHLTHLEVSLRHISAELHELLHVLEEVRQMEDVLRKLNENTNKRVVILSVIALVSLFGVGGYQAMYTKKFFKRKKIL
ncbi:emp24/gp25L/p24 family GOLD domain containing protein [Gracilaria domingensis]|nr:emp24/gp25L/p24 family GOLD domain containing protein [Gracilaria domingensis]